MTCSACAMWCATTERQHASRLKNMQGGGDVYPCPHCKGTDWATTREMIEQEPAATPWWRRSVSWRTMGLLAASSSVLFVVLTAFSTNHLVALFDMYMAGATAALALHYVAMAATRKTLDTMKFAYDEMEEMNRALVQGKFEMHVMSLRRGDDDAPPIAPKLH